MRTLACLVFFASCGVTIAADETGTPFAVGTKVIVQTASGTKHGILRANKTPGWLLLLEDGEKDPVAIKVDGSVTVKAASVDKVQTRKYWDELRQILEELSKGEEDRGFWSRTARLGAYDFQPMSDVKLRRYSLRIRELKSEKVDPKAVDAAEAVRLWVNCVADTRDPKLLLAAMGEGATYNFSPTFERVTAHAKKVREAREGCHKKVDDALEYLKKTYGDEFKSLELPSKAEK